MTLPTGRRHPGMPCGSPPLIARRFDKLLSSVLVIRHGIATPGAAIASNRATRALPASIRRLSHRRLPSAKSVAYIGRWHPQAVPLSAAVHGHLLGVGNGY